MGTAATEPILRRVGIIGDVHGEDRALYAVLDHLLHCPDLDALLCTGDLMDRRSVGDLVQCCNLIADAGVKTVRGEFDQAYYDLAADAPTAATAFIASLPTTLEFQTAAGPLLLCHDCGENGKNSPTTRLSDKDIAVAAVLGQSGLESYRFIVTGHSHRPGVRTLGETTVIDAGSLYWEDVPCFLIADFETGRVELYDVAPFTNQITLAQVAHFAVSAVAAR